MKKILCLLMMLVALPTYSAGSSSGTSTGTSNPGSDISSSIGTSGNPQNANPGNTNPPVGPDPDSGLDSNEQGNPHFPNTNSPPSPHIQPSSPSTTQPSNQPSPSQPTNNY